MSDRELLEKAAKAAGVEVFFNEFGFCQINSNHISAGPQFWNPLHDDGDALRLQLNLNFSLVSIEDGGWACITWDHDDEVTLATDHDPRRAIVRAAAAIAESKEPK